MVRPNMLAETKACDGGVTSASGAGTINYRATDNQDGPPVSITNDGIGEGAPLLLRRLPRERLWSTAVASLVAAMPSLMVGYTLAFPSSALLDLMGEDTDLPRDFYFDDTIAEAFAALAPVGGILGGLVAGPVADGLGRKGALVLCGLPYLTGYLSLSYAQYAQTASGFKAVALVGRFLTGVGMGWACMAGSIYIAEISSPKHRGVFGSFIQIALSVGVLISYAIGSIPDFHYDDSALVAAGIVALFEALMVMSCETPRWLVSRGHESEAYRSLRWLRGPAVDLELEIAKNKSARTSRTNFCASLKEFTRRVPLILVIFVVFFQQSGGINALGSFSASMFEQAGVKHPRATATYAIGGTQLVATLGVVYLIDFVGRKILLVVSGIGMVIGTLLLGLEFYLTRPSLCSSDNSTSTLSNVLQDVTPTPCNTQYGPLAVTSIIIFAVTFSIGWGPIPWILVSELSPLRVRGVVSGLATLVNWGTASVVIGFYTSYSSVVGEWFAWWSFSVSNIAAVIFTIFFLKETKGKSLEDIEEYYQSHKI